LDCLAGPSVSGGFPIDTNRGEADVDESLLAGILDSPDQLVKAMLFIF